MHQLVRYPAALALLSATFLASCTSPEHLYRASVLSLPYSEFDQAYGDGWRSYFEAGDSATAVALLEQYLEQHKELTVGQRKFLHLHAGQIWALQGNNNRAVKHLDAAMGQGTSPHLWPDWDDYISATRAFLMRDRPALLAARQRLAAANAPRVKMADRFIQKFGQSYADVIWWIPVCPTVGIPENASEKQRAAAERLAKKLGCTVTSSETNLPSCCIWVQLRPFGPRAVPKGYVITHTADGTLITASDVEWLDDAVQRFIKSLSQSNGSWEAPFGMVSNFDPNPIANPRFRQMR